MGWITKWQERRAEVYRARQDGLEAEAIAEQASAIAEGRDLLASSPEELGVIAAAHIILGDRHRDYAGKTANHVRAMALLALADHVAALQDNNDQPTTDQDGTTEGR